MLRNFRRPQRRRPGSRSRKTRAREAGRPARSRGTWRPRREVCHGPQRLLWRPVASAVFAAFRRTENRDRKVDGGDQELEKSVLARSSVKSHALVMWVTKIYN